MGSSSYDRDELASSISSLYKLLTKLPYVDPKALVYPPNEENKKGWTGINETELRKRGKTDGIIDLLRHLPYLRQPKSINEAGNYTSRDQKWMLGPETVTIAYCDGDVYDEKMDQIQPTPAHCIWLTDLPEGSDGKALLFDSHTGTITEYTKLAQNIVISPSDYQELPLENRWMAYATVNVVEFFRIWERNFETLIWMAVYHEKGKAGTALWYHGNDMNIDEIYEDSSESDDESYVPDSEEEFSSDDDEYEWDSEYESETEYGISDGEDSSEYPDSKTELQWLKASFQQGSSATPEGAAKQEDMSMLRKHTGEVHSIYILNGWPARFDREKCREQLAEFVDRTENQMQR